MQGSTGEAQHLSHDERRQAIAITRQTLNKNGFQNVVVIAGCGAPSARESIKLCADANDAGAGYVLVLTPAFWPSKMTKEAILAFHREVGTSLPNPAYRSISPGRHPLAPSIHRVQFPWRRWRHQPRIRNHP